MKKDKLENYITQNKDSFNNEEPTRFLWDKISHEIDRPKNKQHKLIYTWLKVAAVFMGLIVTYYLFHVSSNNEVSKPLANITKTETPQIQQKNIIPDSNTNMNSEKFEKPELTNHTNYNIRNATEQQVEKGEIAEVKAYYSMEIKRKESEIFLCADFDLRMKTEIKEEFYNLDSIYNSLKKDLKDNVNNTEVLEAMVQNYKIRLEILDDMLKQLNCSKSKDKNNKRYEI